ncbi:MAG: metal-sensing transcriptional repressor [Oscillospiraceae bacterium]|nr:metal-sensing transcriptional repressor [Oscillospiraceae bacterium]
MDEHTHTHDGNTHTHTHDGVKHSHSHTHTKSVINRIARTSGHLSSVRNMVEQGRDCAEVLVQLAAVRGAINKICEIILKDHLEHCIVDAVETGDKEALNELSKAVELLLK